MTDKEKNQEEKRKFGEVYRYLQDILKYNKPLSPKQVMLIQNLRAGQVVRKGTSVFLNSEGYPYEVILMTMKDKRADIDRSLIKLSGKDELDRTKYVMAIVSNSINDIYLRWENLKRQDEMLQARIEQEDEAIEFKSLSYVKKEKVTTNDFSDLWYTPTQPSYKKIEKKMEFDVSEYW